jgi:hypothetical protein
MGMRSERDFLGRGRAAERALPVGLAGQALVEADLGPPAEVAGDAACIRSCEALVAGPRRLATDDRTPSQDRFELREHLPNVGSFDAADVVDLSHGSVEGRSRCLNAVIDLGVAADL